MLRPVSSKTPKTPSSVAAGMPLGIGQNTARLLGQRVGATMEAQSGLFQGVVRTDGSDICTLTKLAASTRTDVLVPSLAGDSVPPEDDWIGSRLERRVCDPLAATAAHTKGVSTARSRAESSPDRGPSWRG